jgi:hypothetical protein
MLAREQTALEKQLQVAKQLEVDLQASSEQAEQRLKTQQASAAQRLKTQQASAAQRLKKQQASAAQRLQEQRDLIERLQAKGKSIEEELQSRDEGLANALAEKTTETDSQLKQNEEQHRKALELALAERDAGTATLLSDAQSKLEETELKLKEANRERRQSGAYVADLKNKLFEAEKVRQPSAQTSAQEFGEQDRDGAGGERFIEFECVVTAIGGIDSLLTPGRQHKLTATQFGLEFEGSDAVGSDACVCRWAQIPKWRLDWYTEQASEFRFEQSNPRRQAVLRLPTADGHSLMQVLNARCTMVVSCYCVTEPKGDCAEETKLILSHEDGITVYGPPAQWLWWEEVANWELESAAAEENDGEAEMDLFIFTLVGREGKAEEGTSSHELRYEFECDGADGVYLEAAFKWKLAGMNELAGAAPSKKANDWAEGFWEGGTEAVEGDTTTAFTPTQPIRRILEQKAGSAGSAGAGQGRQGAASDMQVSK